MAPYFSIISIIFIDIVYEKLIIFTINLVIQHWEADEFEVCPYLVESSCPGGGLDKADFTVIRMNSCFHGFVFGLGRVGAGDDRLADIDPAGLMFAEAVEGLIDHT